MSNSIKAGDLVMVVKLAPCCGGGTLGLTFTVLSIAKKSIQMCADCGSIREIEASAQYDDRYFVPTFLLKKIDPLKEPEHVDKVEELTA